MRLSFASCRFALALVAFILINVAAAASIKQLPFVRDSEDKGIVAQAADSAVKQFEQLPAPPHVVLIGSSVMMAPLWSCDSLAYRDTGDIYHYHASRSLDALLRAHGIKGNSFTFALPGAMVSDMFLITDKLLTKDRAPQVLVYGVSPRDFMDDLLTGETRTAVFQRLSGIDDLFHSADLYLASWTEKADFVMSNGVFLYGKRCRYQDKLSGAAQKLADKISKSNALAANKHEGGFAFAEAGNHNRADMWQKSIDEYRARYRHFNEKQFGKQSQFLAELLKTAEERGIKVLLVNMPLTADNLALMPPGLYDSYKESLSALAGRYDARLVDLQESDDFQNVDFFDTVHLNAAGGSRLLRKLTAGIEQCSAQGMASEAVVRVH